MGSSSNLDNKDTKSVEKIPENAEPSVDKDPKLVENLSGDMDLSSNLDNKDAKSAEIPENAEPSVDKDPKLVENLSGEEIVKLSGHADSDVAESHDPENAEPKPEVALCIEEKRNAILGWIDGLPSLEDAREDAARDEAAFLGGLPEEEPSDVISLKRKLFRQLLEVMYTEGVLARAEEPYTGYFRNLAASLGSCSDSLYGIMVIYQTNSAPKVNSLETSLAEISKILLEGDVICLKDLCQESNTFLAEGNMIDLKQSLTNLYDKIKEAEDELAELQADDVDDW